MRRCAAWALYRDQALSLSPRVGVYSTLSSSCPIHVMHSNLIRPSYVFFFLPFRVQTCRGLRCYALMPRAPHWEDATSKTHQDSKPTWRVSTFIIILFFYSTNLSLQTISTRFFTYLPKCPVESQGNTAEPDHVWRNTFIFPQRLCRRYYKWPGMLLWLNTPEASAVV